MKQNISLKYILIQFLYWVSFCACAGFVAVYLQFYGVSNTIIGIVVGLQAILYLLVQSFTNTLLQKIRLMTSKKMILAMIIIMIVAFASITFVHAPVILVMLVFIIVNILGNCMTPLLSALGMEYMNQKRNINFGVARGIGALGWALSAAFIGLLLKTATPQIIGYVFIISAAIMFVILLTMDDPGEYNYESQNAEKNTGLMKKVLKDKIFMFVSLGIFFNLIGHILLTTYGINIVRNVGGAESAVGYAQFFAAASEMVVMIIFSFLIRKLNSLQIIKISSIFFIIRFILILNAANLPMVMIGYALQGPTNGLYIPAAVYFVNEHFSHKHQAQGQIIFNILTNGIAGCIGNIAGGWLQDTLGLHTTLLLCTICTLIGCACIITRNPRHTIAPI